MQRTHQSRPLVYLSSALCAATLLCCASTAHAATISVTNTAPSGAGSLQQAIVDANASAGLDTGADTHIVDDDCPRNPLPGGVDPNPDPAKPLKDKGCAGGEDVTTDVFIKQ